MDEPNGNIQSSRRISSRMLQPPYSFAPHNTIYYIWRPSSRSCRSTLKAPADRYLISDDSYNFLSFYRGRCNLGVLVLAMQPTGRVPIIALDKGLPPRSYWIILALSMDAIDDPIYKTSFYLSCSLWFWLWGWLAEIWSRATSPPSPLGGCSGCTVRSSTRRRWCLLAKVLRVFSLSV